MSPSATPRRRGPTRSIFITTVIDHARDLREVFADTDGDDVRATSRRAQVAADHALDTMTGDTEWRALYLEFLAHAARDAAFRRRFAKRCADTRGALDEVVRQRTAPVTDALGMAPEQLALVIDALGTGLMSAHMLHGPRAVTPDLFSKTLALLVDGIAARAGAPAQPQRSDRCRRPISSARGSRACT